MTRAAVEYGTPSGGARETATRQGRTVVFASGKGGVGQSALIGLMGATLAARGLRTLVSDAGHAFGHLHLLLGARTPVTLEAVLTAERRPGEMLTRVRDHMWLLPGAGGAEALRGLSAVDRARHELRMSHLHDAFDVSLVDAGPGPDDVLRAAAVRADRVVLVLIPEPAALCDAYVVLKLIVRELPGLPVDVLVNRVAHDDEARDSFARLELAVGRFLGHPITWLGAVHEHAALGRAVRRPGALLAEAPPGLAIATQTLATRLGLTAPVGESR